MHFLAFFEKYFGLNKASNFSIFANLAIWQQALIASAYCGWPIIGRFSRITGGLVGVLACVGTLFTVSALSFREFPDLVAITPKAISLMLIAGVVNGVAVYFYSLKVADETIPTAAFVATVCIFMVMAAPIQHWILNGVAPSWRQGIGYGLAALAVYFLK